ncbi:sterol desaturase family protein [Aliikangiella coralliicola]|uniref:Sterol desaturase family protein n=1 Tax=Aliikangiella coralliicola TaxID=2592383 RepID=A0A545UC55_9GAMM|nr:sterol desaturase family protein [Aliikangiella coralliicola]TQV87044.1 sterol desaturase family protein [Aliikangiella coralliicola]
MPEESHIYKPRKTEDMSDRAFRLGEGKISGYLSCSLGILSFLAVLCYQFPAYLTTADLRAVYDAKILQVALMITLWSSLGFALLTFILSKHRRLGAIGVVFSLLAFSLGGYTIPVRGVESNTLSLGLDWLILTLIASVMIFTFLEKIIPKYREQAILRPEWQLDLFYFCFNHLLIAVLLLISNYFVVTVFGWAASSQLQAWVQSLPVVVQVVILIVCADFVLYWSHRFFHENPGLWKIHAVHHSVEHMDWLAGSRNHIVQTIVDRSIAMLPLYLLGADKAALDIYVTFAAFQAVLVHANIGIPFGPLKYLVVTPLYHHWHHSSDKPAIDSNYAVHLPLFDRLFGTYHMPSQHWPQEYGTTKRLPRTFLGQLFYPFKRSQ